MLENPGLKETTGSANHVPLVGLIIAVTGVSVLAVCITTVMVACLVRLKAKARKHKLGKISVSLAQCSALHYNNRLDRSLRTSYVLKSNAE